MINFAAILLLIIIVGSSVGYIIKKKKMGTRCIGCPHAQSCSKKTCK